MIIVKMILTESQAELSLEYIAIGSFI